MYLKALLITAAAFCLPGMAYATGTTTPPATITTALPTTTSSTPTTNTSSTPGGNQSSATTTDNSAPGSSAAASSSSSSSSLSSSGGNSLGSGGNNTTSLDLSDRSIYKSQTVFIPSVVPGTPPSHLGVGNIIRETSACGPLQRIVRAPVNGTFIGLFQNTALPQGWSDDLEPFVDPSGARIDYRQVVIPNGDIRMFGHQVTMFTTVIGVASNRNIALGGGEGAGWGQAGMGASSSNQQMVTTIQLRECEIGTMHRVVREVFPKDIRR